MTPALDSIIATDALQPLLEDFQKLMGLGVTLTRPSGKVVVQSGRQSVCDHCPHSPAGIQPACRNQDASDAGNHCHFICYHGLLGVCLPIESQTFHLADLICGPFFDRALEEPDIDALCQQMTRHNGDRGTCLASLMNIPILSSRTAAHGAAFFKRNLDLLAGMALGLKDKEAGRQKIAQAHATLSSEVQRQQAQTRQLAGILDGSPIATFVVNAEGKLVLWNRACELLTGLPASQMVGTDRHREAFYTKRRELMVDLIVRDADIDEMAGLYGKKFKVARLTREGYQGEGFFPKIGSDGKWLLFTGAPIRDADGKVTGAIETILDNTEHHRDEEKLRYSEARYRQLFEAANDGILVLQNGIVVDCNHKASEIASAPREEIIGQSVLDISSVTQPNGELSKDEIVRRIGLNRQEVPQFFEWRFQRRDGTLFDAEVSLNYFAVADAPYALAIVRDISARKKMIRALETHKQELDDKSRYLEKVNQALKASLDHREVEKRSIEEGIYLQLKRFVYPYLEELSGCTLDADARAYVNIIHTNVNDLITPYSTSLFAKYMDLTPTEVRIADFIRDGKNSKAIAGVLGLSPSSVQWHRKNIREKLGLTNKKVNLHNYLASRG